MTSPPHGRQTGRFSYDMTTRKWDWDDDVFRIHGYEPGSVEPTTGWRSSASTRTTGRG